LELGAWDFAENPRQNYEIGAAWLPAAEHPAADQPERQQFRHTDDTAGWYPGKP
jgi:hypothetical protein